MCETKNIWRDIMITLTTTRQEIINQLTEEYESSKSTVVKSTIARVQSMTESQFEDFRSRRIAAYDKYGH